ncbi:hypothetical protein EVA_08188 [gut metagenome]|uniref:Uncharacterized protein n=1 Tax=gut metagenome TaxID=749906 RepID=J9GTL8_9ZZZZ
MICQHILEETTGMSFDNLVILDTADFHDLLSQSLSDDVHFTVGSLYNGVALTGVKGDTHVTGQSPDGGSPDNEEELAAVKVREFAQIVVHGELDIDSSAGVILILNLCLSKSSLIFWAPVNRFQTFVDVSVFVHLTKDADFFSLKALVHGLVGIFPVAQNTETLKAFSLLVNILLSILLAGISEVGNGHGLMVKLLLFYDGALYGHSVVIPARNIWGIVTTHSVRTDYEVLYGLVECVTHVYVTVREWRAVVKNKLGATLILLQKLMI